MCVPVLQPSFGQLERVLLGLDGHLHVVDVVHLLLDLLLRLQCNNIDVKYLHT